MTFSAIAQHYLRPYKARYGATTTNDQWSALNAILGCRTAQYGQIHLVCTACAEQSSRYRSCGHRSCNQCQHHCTTQWLQRQQAKLLPVNYFMVTFTLPAQLRHFAKVRPKRMYALLLQCAVATLKDFGLNEKGLAAELAMTAVLHTHSRRLDYHPHVHVIVPGGGVNKARNEWRKVKGQYLFNGRKLAAVFRGRLLAAIAAAGLTPPLTPKKWVVQCQHVGHGLPALKYLSRYLYRGVISNNNILRDDGSAVTFQYKDSDTGTMMTRTLPGEDFIALVLQHTLPRGFRRVRDYGFLHGNAKRLLRIVQWALQIAIPKPQQTQRPQFICARCQAPLSIIGFQPPSRASG